MLNFFFFRDHVPACSSKELIGLTLELKPHFHKQIMVNNSEPWRPSEITSTVPNCWTMNKKMTSVKQYRPLLGRKGKNCERGQQQIKDTVGGIESISPDVLL